MRLRLQTLLSLGLLALTGLAGCAETAPPGTAEDDCHLEPVLCDPEHYLANHPCIKGDVHPRVYAPDTPGPDSPADPWRLGDYWVYEVDAGGRRFTSTLVYYEDIDFASGQAQHYLVGSASRQEAFDHALFSINPMLGRIHRTLYSPHESGLHADMFNFPLCQGSTWVTGFYDTTFDLQAQRATIALPGGASDPLGFTITGTSGDGSTLRHTYSPAAKWFTDLEMRRADGLVVTMRLTESGSGKAGTYHFLRAQQDEVLDVARIDRSVTVGREDGGEGPYHTVGVWMDVQRTAGNGRLEVHVRDPSGVSRACVGFSGGLAPSTCSTGPLKVEVPYAAGDWTVTVETQVGDFTTRAAGEVRLVSIYNRSGPV